MNRTALITQVALTAMAIIGSIAVYHRFVAVSSTSLRFGVVDVGEVYRLKEKQLLEMVSKAGSNEADKKRATEMAMEFTKTLPAAIDQLPKDCQCMVLVRGAVAAETPNIVDLTPILKAKVGVGV